MVKERMDLVTKYDIQAPRYTSYPPVPFWNKEINQELWIKGLKASGDLDSGIDLYIHIPYCHSLCWYCGCHKVITKDQSVEIDYVNYLIKEWNIYKKNLGEIKINSIHLGGGTPSFITAKSLERLFSVVLENRTDDFIGAIEIDPRVITDDQLKVFKDFGFKRISMGIQDFDHDVQVAIHREQPFEMVKQLCARLRELEFESVNFDLIYGLPKQTAETIRRSIELVNTLAPDMIAFYSYAHVPWKVKNQNLIKDEDLPLGNEKKRLAEIGEELLISTGYTKIGFDHFAKNSSFLTQTKNEGKLLRSFMGYTDKKSVSQIALGVSGIGNSDAGFVQNDKIVKSYYKTLDEGNLPIINGHLNNERDVTVAKLIQDIMCNSKAIIPNTVTTQDRMDRLLEMQDDGLIQINDDHLHVTEVGVDFLRNIATIFDDYLKSDSVGFSRTV
jgi:oxygen-independent coproporphyrinogen III oxidase